jgi:hypothetical protein
MALDLSRQLVLRWPGPDQPPAALLEEAGIEGTVGIGPLEGTDPEGLWPGIRLPRNANRDEMTASASSEPWVDANGYRVALARALNPTRNPVLAYEPTEKAGLTSDRMVEFETLELALAEARVGGGNYVLALERRYRDALLKRDPAALEAWASLGRTARWFSKNAALFGRPTHPAITYLVEPGYPTAELANLAYRRGCSPALVTALNPPAPDPSKIQVLVAASVKALEGVAWRRVLAHAEAGATVVVDSKPEAAWKVARKDEDRTFYSLGKGQVVAYHKRIADPSEFALDVIDLLTHRRRAARLWNAPSAIPLATVGASPRETLLHIVNYGGIGRREVQARVQGRFNRATLLAPGKDPADLKVYHRAQTSEVFPPELGRITTIHFS